MPTGSRALGARSLGLLLSVFVSIALITSTCADSQDTPGSTHSEDAAIEQVAAAAVKTLDGGDWETLAEFMHPEALQDFKDMVVPAVELFDKQGYEEAPSMLSLFDGATDLESVVALQPKEFFVSFFTGVSRSMPELEEALTGTDCEIIGTVREGSDLAHVVCRQQVSLQGTDMSVVDAISLKLSGTEWKMLLTSRMEALAEWFGTLTQEYSAGDAGGQGAPNVMGLTLEQATNEAEANGLRIEVTEEVPIFDSQPGIVKSQEPEQGIDPSDGVLRVTLSREPIPVQITYLQDYDPAGDNGQENADQVPHLIDANRSTTWSTEEYERANFNGLKPGVGLIFTLAEGATRMRIISTTPGWQGQLLQVTTEGATAQIATLGDSSIVTLQPAIAEGRIWITTLALLPDSDRYGVHIAEIAFYK